MAAVRFRELINKYGKVAVGVHLSVSACSITGLYVAITNNLDVQSILDKFHIGAISHKDDPNNSNPNSSSSSDDPFPVNAAATNPNSRSAQLAASAGGAFTLAILCNKALLPVRVSITVALTPPIARFLARRNIVKSGI